MSASSTLKEAFERRGATATSSATRWITNFILRGRVSLHHHATTDLGDAPIDAVVGLYLRMCRSLIGRSTRPAHRVSPLAPAKLDDFLSLLRAPLVFDAPQTRFGVRPRKR